MILLTSARCGAVETRLMTCDRSVGGPSVGGRDEGWCPAG